MGTHFFKSIGEYIMIKYNKFFIVLMLVAMFFVFSQNINAYTNGETYWGCSDCSDCEAALQDNGHSEVRLTANINNHAGTCIDNPANFNNKIFDCQGNTIDGDDSDVDYGIFLSEKSGNIIK
ncbi:MAG: hypothetical protein CO072_00290, partial [Candidatus Huberarchaeum crystalense]